MLGDSLTVGWGVNAEATFSKRLESLLNGNGTHAEVINAGAGNWNTIQEVQYFLTKGYKYRPDIIVLNYFLNDAEPVPHSRPPSFLMRHCYSCFPSWPGPTVYCGISQCAAIGSTIISGCTMKAGDLAGLQLNQLSVASQVTAKRTVLGS